MVEVRFINDTTPIEVTSDEQETQIDVISETQTTEIQVGGLAHADLSGRDLPDQHNIGAITGLQDALDNVVNNIEGGSNIEVERHGDRAIINSTTFIFEQSIASDVWVIKHNLNKAPNITLVDSSGAEFQARKVYNSLNQVTIYLNGATTGKAYLN